MATPPLQHSPSWSVSRSRINSCRVKKDILGFCTVVRITRIIAESAQHFFLFFFLQSGTYQPGNIGYLPMTTSPADSFRQVFTKTNFHTNECKDTFLISDLLKVNMVSFISKELHFE